MQPHILCPACGGRGLMGTGRIQPCLRCQGRIPLAPPVNGAMDRRSRGQGLFEYALIILFVVLVVIVSLTLIGSTLAHSFSQLAPSL